MWFDVIVSLIAMGIFISLTWGKGIDQTSAGDLVPLLISLYFGLRIQIGDVIQKLEKKEKAPDTRYPGPWNR